LSPELQRKAERSDELLSAESDELGPPFAQFRPVGAPRNTLDQVVGGKQRHVAKAARLLGEVGGEESDGGVVVGLTEG
jgi:hypothetical protein